MRNDEIGRNARLANPEYTCNGCGHYEDLPAGTRVKWPTQYASHKGDIIPVSECPDGLKCFTLMVGSHIFHNEMWDGKDFIDTPWGGDVKKKLAELEITNGYLVTVDYHS